MAAPSEVSDFPFTISQTGEANGALLALSQAGAYGPDATLKIGVSGTYGTAVLVVRGRLAGMSNFFPIAGVDCKDNTAVGTGGSITLTDNTSYLLKFPVAGFDQVEVYCSSLASGSVVIEKASGPAESVSPPVVNATTTTTTTSLAAATTVTSTSANALAVGANGATNPVLKINAATASVATGLAVTGAAAAGGLALAVISSGTNENLTIDAKGSGTITLNGTGTGGITLSRAVTCSSTLSCTALTATSVAATGNVALTGHLTVTDAKNVVLDSTTGTKIGTATTQKLAFYNSTPVVQPAANTDTTTGAAGSGTAVYLNTTVTGGGTAAYTLGGMCAALKALGLLAA